MQPSEIIRATSEHCGLPARGESWREGLDIFLDEFSSCTTATPEGREATRQTLINVLAARFRIEDWLAKHPALEQRPIARPVFIFGMPRAGTTLLFNLLARDPARRFIWSWESGREVPPVKRGQMHSDPRIARKIAEVDEALRLGYLDHRQYVELGDEPGECGFVLGEDMKSMLWMVQAPLPIYSSWLLHKADMVACYRYHKRVLQLLQAEEGGQWTLKYPSHAHAMKELLQVYPDARIVVTHRDPIKPVGSSCDNVKFFMEQKNRDIDLHAIGSMIATQWQVAAERVMQARDGNPQVPTLDMHYRRLVADPIGQIKRLYAFLGDELKPEVIGAMQRRLEAQRQVRAASGPHEYRLETFGLTRAGLEKQFSSYIERHTIEMERDT
jgi:hypothetical protein